MNITFADLGRQATGIYVVKNPNTPQFRFEWHPQTRRVYLICLDVLPHIGNPIAFDIDNHGAAINAVLIWCRGYKYKAAELAPLENRP